MRMLVVLPTTAIRHVLLGRAFRHQLVECGARLLWSQHPPQPLDVLAPRAVAAHNDRHAAVGDVYTLVEHAPGHQLRIAPAAEAFEDQPALFGRRLIGDLRDAELAADLLDHDIVFAEDENSL